MSITQNRKSVQRSSKAASTLNAALKGLNKKHFIATEAGRTVVFTERYDALLDRHVMDRSGAVDIKLRYGNQWFETKNPRTGKEESKPLGEIWLRSKHRRQFEGIIFDPQSPPTTRDNYNLWRGFSVKPAKGDWSLMRDHIENIICGGNRAAHDYLLKYMALTVQHPQDHPQVAVVLRGGEGVGKGTFVESFGRLFGTHYYKASTSRQVTGQFGGHLENVVVLFADEAVLANNPDAVGVLKGLITESMIGVEAKYRNAAMVRSYLHVFMASNSEWVVPAAEDARRFFVLNVSDARKQDTKYFRRLHAQIRAGGSAAMLYDLLHTDLSGFNVLDVPKTEALLEQKLLSLRPIESWWLAQLENGRLLGVRWSGPLIVEIGDMVDSFKQDTAITVDGRSLGAGIRKLLPGKLLDGPQRNRQRTWSIPPLAECWKSFNEWIGADYFKNSRLADTSCNDYDDYDDGNKLSRNSVDDGRTRRKSSKPSLQLSSSLQLSEAEAAWESRYGGDGCGRFI